MTNEKSKLEEFLKNCKRPVSDSHEKCEELANLIAGECDFKVIENWRIIHLTTRLYLRADLYLKGTEEKVGYLDHSWAFGFGTTNNLVRYKQYSLDEGDNPRLMNKITEKLGINFKEFNN